MIPEEQRFCVFVPLEHTDAYWSWFKETMKDVPRRRRYRLNRAWEPVWIRTGIEGCETGLVEHCEPAKHCETKAASETKHCEPAKH